MMLPVVFSALIALGAPVVLGAEPVAYSEPNNAVFALIVGVNRSVDEGLEPLSYADDDAARYFDLYRSLGARAILVSRFDENTRRLHTQAAAEARPPTMAEFDAAVSILATEVEQANQKGISTSLYFIYAGHGNTGEGNAYLTMEDGRLNADDLHAALRQKVRAKTTHLIVDACYAAYLARQRGPGGKRRSLRGFSLTSQLAKDPSVGLLLSATVGARAHEWEAIQAGVFSHEVRSGLFGAADVDGDSLISYLEIEAFVTRANQGIENEKYRPKLFAKAPKESDKLLDLRNRTPKKLEIGPSKSGHHYLEDDRGVRLADFNPAAGHRMWVMRPNRPGKLFLHDITGRVEYELDSTPVISIDELDSGTQRVAVRGAREHAFSKLFAVGFNASVVQELSARKMAQAAAIATAAPKNTWLKPVGYSALGLTAAALVIGIGLNVHAGQIGDSGGLEPTQAQVASWNDKIDAENRASWAMYGFAGATALTGLVMLLWGDESITVTGGTDGQGGFVGYGGRF
jgi:hypothetical protein